MSILMKYYARTLVTLLVGCLLLGVLGVAQIWNMSQLSTSEDMSWFAEEKETPELSLAGKSLVTCRNYGFEQLFETSDSRNWEADFLAVTDEEGNELDSCIGQNEEGPYFYFWESGMYQLTMYIKARDCRPQYVRITIPVQDKELG